MTVDAPIFVGLALALVLSGRLAPIRCAPWAYAIASVIFFLCVQGTLLGAGVAAAFVLLPWLGLRLLGPARGPLLVAVQVAVAVALRFGAGLFDTPLAVVGLSYIILRQVEWLIWVHESPVEAGDTLAAATHQLGFFTLLAGPVLSYGDVGSRVMRRPASFTAEDAVTGLERVARGYLYVTVVAPVLREATTLERLAAADYGPLAGAVCLYGFPFALYLDFAGYTHIVLGFARLAGQTLPENFDRPFAARNVQQFWQRWHMSFSTWARVFVFTPVMRRLRSGPRRLPERPAQAVALLMCFTFVGLWHGASTSFLLFGVLHGLAVFALLPWGDFLARRLGPEGLKRYRQSRVVSGLAWVFCFHFLCVTIALFGRPLSAVIEAFARVLGGG